MRAAEKIKIALGFAAVLLLCARPMNAYADNDKIAALEDQINKKKEEQEQTRNEIDERKDELEELGETTEGLKGQLNSLNASLTEVSNNLAMLESEIEIKNLEIDKALEELSEARQTEDQQYEAMKKRVKFMYEKRDFMIFEMLFGAESLADFLNHAEYIEKLSAYDRKKLDEFEAARQEVELAKAKLEEEREALEELRVSVEEEQERYSGLVNQTSGKISTYQQEMSQTEAEMLEYERKLQEQKNDIAKLQEELAEERRLSQLAAQSAWRDISEITFAEGDRYLLANLIYCEAGNQPYEGQVAVGAVVMNRVMSSVFPDTVVGVIYQNRQFSPVASGRLALALSENHATNACYQAADAAMSGTTTVGNCLFFRTPIEGLTGTQIGGHIFY
ncbi:cell wall hydrolase [bacterium 1xD8-48]|nr:cell wall hydrolase [Lachnospiraceae bacterium]NBJ99344.1 cell wall hydrolase [bacterium 1xD8-48]